jgi:topoisomerase IA-like protein
VARYSKTSSRKVKRAMHERKRGTLRSGRSGRKVTSRKQAVAIGLSEARRSGAHVPSRPVKKKTAAKKSSARRSGARRATRSRS